jgi:hypothetical protein
MKDFSNCEIAEGKFRPTVVRWTDFIMCNNYTLKKQERIVKNIS